MGGLFVIGERPGPEEVERGEPFIGRSGDWLNPGFGGMRVTGPEALKLWEPFRKPVLCLGCSLYDKGLSFVPGAGNERLFVSNTRRCLHEAETEMEWTASVAHCAGLLQSEMERIQPRALLLVGGDALKSLTGLDDPLKFHGSVWHRAAIDEIRQTLGVFTPLIPSSVHTIVFSLHPAYAMRRGVPQLRPSIKSAVVRAMRWSERLAGPSFSDWSVGLEPTPDELASYLLDGEGPVIFDIETEHENHAAITLCGASARDRHALVTAWTEPFIGIWREFFAGPRLKVAQNSPFDRNGLAAWGIEVAPPVEDTLHRGALLHPPFDEAEKMRWLNLPTMALRMLDGLANWKETEKPETRAFYRAMFPRVPEWLHARLYNGIDNIVTRLLYDAQEEALAMEGML